ncbi:MAG: carboxy terminal-processing peptidase [Bacteroidia bacterium]|nr:carboxy terminal-processing peptidase [Bacteroidia bacterium]
MQYKKSFFFSLTAFVLIFVAAKWNTIDNSQKESIILQTMMAGLNQLHFQPVQIDDQFSANVYDLYMKRLDRGKRFLTYHDYNKLKKYQYDIDDQIQNGNYELFNLSADLMIASLQKTKNFYKEILTVPFDFDKVEYIELDGEKRKFAENDTELKELWRKQLKYETLTRVEERLEAKEEGKEEWVDKSLEEIEKLSRQSIEDRYDRWFNSLEKLDRMDRMSVYLNSITGIYDPHTNYLEPIDKQTFDFNMSGRLEGIGAQLTQDGDYTKVSTIVPGGPAWKAGELEVDDLILKVTQGDDGEAENVVGLNLDDVVSKIRGKKGTVVRLFIRKADESEKEIKITRDEIIFEETYAKSLLLDLPDTEQVGYVYLPRFYADYEKTKRSCSQDVADEIDKLKAEGAKGIILDLRNNGGGYLQEVINMTGLFIEDGPVVQEKYRMRDAIVRKDRDEAIHYDGPLVVLVNGFSASASEIISAALQDYGRAIIVGSKSTYGKGTVQQFIDLDRAIQGNSDVKPLGSLRVTIRKYYRIDGGSVQLKGVEPDIILPDNYAFIDTGEKDQEFPLEWTEIQSATYDASKFQIANLKEIIESSEERIKENEVFGLITQNAHRVKSMREKTSYPLNLKDYQTSEANRLAEAKRFEDIQREIVDLDVRNLQADEAEINATDKAKKLNSDFVESVKTDVYLEEAMRIVQDIIAKE